MSIRIFMLPCKIMHENDIGAVVIVKDDKERHDNGVSNDGKQPIGIIT